MRVVAVIVVALVLVPDALASGSRPVAIVTAETSNQVVAVSLGPHGGHVLKRVHLADPLMVAAPLHGPAVVLSPATGTVRLLGWHSLRQIKVFHGFRDPEVARIAPGDRYAYVNDGGTGKLSVIDLARRRIVDRISVGAGAHHMAFSPDGKHLWIALSEVATTVVRVNTSNLRRPRVVGRIHPRFAGHSVGWSPDGRTVWLSSARDPYVMVYRAATGTLVKLIRAGKAPQEVAFSGARALLTSGYGSSIEAVLWRTYRRLGTAPLPYGSFNLATFGGEVVTSSLLTGYVTELEAGTLHRFWTTKVAPAPRYVAISVWPDPPPHRTLSVASGRVVRRFTMREAAGVIRLVRLVVPRGVHARVSATIPRLAGISIGAGGRCIDDRDKSWTCVRRGGYEIWTQQEEACPMPRAVWRVRLVKGSGPAGRIRFAFRVGRR